MSGQSINGSTRKEKVIIERLATGNLTLQEREVSERLLMLSKEVHPLIALQMLHWLLGLYLDGMCGLDGDYPFSEWMEAR